MAVTKKNGAFDATTSPSNHANIRRKFSMVVKKPKAPRLDSSISTIEGELTNFLSNETKKLNSSKQNEVDDGTHSTTSRTTKSSHGSKHNYGEQQHNESSSRSKRGNNNNSDINSNNNSHSNLNDLDWAQHSDNRMNMKSEENFPAAGLPDLESDEHLRLLNDRDNGKKNHENFSESSLTSPIASMNMNSPSGKRSRRPHPSRRIAKQQEMQFAMLHHSSSGQIGERNNSNSNSNSDQSGERSGRRSSELRVPSSVKARRPKSKGSGTNSDETPPTSSMNTAITSRRKASGKGSGRHGNRTISVRSKSRDTKRNMRSRSNHRSSSPTNSIRSHRSRLMTGSHKSAQSKSIDQTSQHSRASTITGSHKLTRSKSVDRTSQNSAASTITDGTPYSPLTRRGRRWGSLNDGSNHNIDHVNANHATRTAAATISSPTPSGKRSERGRRRSSIKHATTNIEEQRQMPQRHRGNSLLARICRRKSPGDKGRGDRGSSTNKNELSSSSHHKHRSKSVICTRKSPGDKGRGDRGSSNNKNELSSSSRHKHRSKSVICTRKIPGDKGRGDRGSSSNKNELSSSRHKHRSKSVTNKNRRSRSKSNGPSSSVVDRSYRSMRTDELLPERLSNVLGRSASNTQDSKLEWLALSILVAEEDNDLDQSLHDAFAVVPPHLLDPSNVRMNMQW